MRKIVLLIFALLLASGVERFPPKQVTVQETRLPTPASEPSALAIDQAGRIWVAERAVGKIAVYDPALDEINEHNLRLGEDDPVSLSTGQMGFIWFVTQISNDVGRMNLETGELKRWSPPTYAGFSDIVVDEGGQVWLAETARGSIGTLDPATGDLMEFDAQGMHPKHLVVHEELVWFADPDRNVVAYLRPSTKELKPFSLPVDTTPGKLTVDNHGHVWIVLPGTNRIGELDPSTGELTEYMIPTPNSEPRGIAVGEEGYVWFTETRGNKIARLDRETKEVIEVTVPTPDAEPVDLAIDEAGRVWFVEQKGNRIGMLMSGELPSGENGDFVAVVIAMLRENQLLVAIVLVAVTSAAAGFLLRRRGKARRKRR